MISTISIAGDDQPCKCIEVASIIRNTLDYVLMECPRLHLPSQGVLSTLESVCMSSTVISCRRQIAILLTTARPVRNKTMKAFMMHSMCTNCCNITLHSGRRYSYRKEFPLCGSLSQNFKQLCMLFPSYYLAISTQHTSYGVRGKQSRAN